MPEKNKRIYQIKSVMFFHSRQGGQCCDMGISEQDKGKICHYFQLIIVTGLFAVFLLFHIKLLTCFGGMENPKKPHLTPQGQKFTLVLAC